MDENHEPACLTPCASPPSFAKKELKSCIVPPVKKFAAPSARTSARFPRNLIHFAPSTHLLRSSGHTKHKKSQIMFENFPAYWTLRC